MLEAFKKTFKEFFRISETNETVCRKRCLDSDDSSNGPQNPKQRKIEKSFIHMTSYDFLMPFSSNISSNKMNISQTPKTTTNPSLRLGLFKSSHSKENLESKLENDDEGDGLCLSRPSMKLKLKYKENKSNGYKTPGEDEKDDVQVIHEVSRQKQKGISLPTKRSQSPKLSRRYIPGLQVDFSVVNKLQNVPEGKPSTFPVQAKIPRSQSALDETVRLDEKRKYLELLQHCMGSGRRFFGSSTSGKGLTPRKAPIVEEIDLTEKSAENDIQEIKVVKLKDKPPPKIDKCSGTKDDDDIEIISVFKPSPRNQSQKYKKHSPFNLDWISELTENYDFTQRERERRINEKEVRAALYHERNKKLSADILEERIRNHMKITDLSFDDDIVLYDDEPQLPKLTPAMESIVSAAFRPDPRSEVLVEGFSLRITRYDIQSLAGTNWLNDEVINFYMNLLIERGKNNNYPSVYAFNTFFYPKLASSGYSTLKRWTRKVDVFANDILIVPVHLGMHWCMAAIDFRNKSICYYDSLGAPNNQCLTLLVGYLESESMDKKKIPFNRDGWYLENAKNIPQQMNGSDCGMFSCTYAEFICRNAKFSFSQKEMPYFRRKMVYEILTKTLMI